MITYKKLFKVLQVLTEVDTDKTEIASTLEDKQEDIQACLDKYQKELKIIRRRNAVKDKQANILKDEFGNYKYTEESEAKIDDEIEELADKEIDLEISPIELTPELEKRLGKGIVKVFTGFFFKETETRSFL